MLNYILKRLLLMIPTLFGVMLVTFLVTQFVPGGPVEQLISQLEGGSAAGGGRGGERRRGAGGSEPGVATPPNRLNPPGIGVEVIDPELFFSELILQ